MKKLYRITTVPISLEKLLENQLTFMSNFYEVTAISSEKHRLEKFGLENNLKTEYIELTRKITPAKDLIALWKMFWLFKKEKPFIVHSHTPKAGTIGMLAAKLAGVPNRLHTVAGLPLLEVSGTKRKILNLVEKLTYNAATKVYPNSFGLQEIILKERFCKPGKLKVIGNGSSNGIDTSYFDPTLFNQTQKESIRKSLNINENDFVFIFVGRLVTDKGINELVKAFDEINQNKKEIKLLLVGPKEDELDPLSSETESILNSNQNIILTGYQSDVRPFFAISDVLTFPSYREGFPNVVMQAGAMGLPSIVSNINGCNEIIINNENGVIIPSKDTISLKNVMQELSSNTSKNQQMSFNARSRIVSKYKREFIWEALQAEYNSL